MHISEDSEELIIFWSPPLIVILLALLLPIGFVRKRRSSNVVKAFAWAVYNGTSLLVSYFFRVMQSLPMFGSLTFAIWAVSLVFVYGSIDRVNALALNDRKSITVIWVIHSFNFIFAFTLVVRLFTDRSILYLSVPLFGGLLYSCYKVIERMVASHYTNPDNPTLVSLVSKVSKSIKNDDDYHDPLQGCNYVVDPDDQGITVDKVSSCDDGSILSRDCEREPSRQLNNTCLSFSLFWLLLHKFVGIPSYESSHQEAAWNYVTHGLLKDTTNSFTVIEVELEFLHDFIYTKYFSFYLKGFRIQLIKHLVFHLMFTCTIIGILVLAVEDGPDKGEQLIFDQLMLASLLIPLFVMVVIEVVQGIAFFTSKWSKMMLICMYLKRESWKKQNPRDYCINLAVRIICPRTNNFKPWQRKLGQYSLLESFSSHQHLLWRIVSLSLGGLTGIRILQPGRKYSNGITLTDKIKEDVIQSLQSHGSRLTNGIASMVNQLPDSAIKRKLVSASNQLNTDAHVILICHIATSLCEINPLMPTVGCHSADFHVATSLSKHCAYLVAFAPDLLPGHPATTDYVCAMTIDDAYTRMKDCESSQLYDRLVEIAGDLGDLEAAKINVDNILQQGAMLGKVLDTEITDEGKRWEILAGFWAEMILYLAPNMNNEWAHVERLADGGEFITHLWALLFHAGIVNRDFIARHEVSASSETNTASAE